MNSKMAYLTALAALAMSEPSPRNRVPYLEKEVDKEELDKQRTQLLIKKGAKVFEIDGQMYLALNLKNAIKKHDRYKLTLSPNTKEQ